MKIPADRYVTAEVGDDLFLLDEQTGESFRLGGSAGRVWELLVAGASAPQVTDTIVAESGADATEVTADVDAFIALLVAAGIAEPDTS